MIESIFENLGMKVYMPKVFFEGEAKTKLGDTIKVEMLENKDIIVTFENADAIHVAKLDDENHEFPWDLIGNCPKEYRDILNVMIKRCWEAYYEKYGGM